MVCVLPAPSMPVKDCKAKADTVELSLTKCSSREAINPPTLFTPTSEREKRDDAGTWAEAVRHNRPRAQTDSPSKSPFRREHTTDLTRRRICAAFIILPLLS